VLILQLLICLDLGVEDKMLFTNKNINKVNSNIFRTTPTRKVFYEPYYYFANIGASSKTYAKKYFKTKEEAHKFQKFIISETYKGFSPKVRQEIGGVIIGYREVYT